MIFSLTSVVVLLAGHWIGDFVLQTNVIAKEKSRNIRWLLLHVAIYIAVISVCTVILFPLNIWLAFILVNGILHFMTDLITGKLTLRFQNNQRLYFIIIGFDQMIHAITLIGSLYLLASFNPPF